MNGTRCPAWTPEGHRRAGHETRTGGKTLKHGIGVAKVAPQRRTAAGSTWLRRASSEGLTRAGLGPSTKGQDEGRDVFLGESSE